MTTEQKPADSPKRNMGEGRHVAVGYVCAITVATLSFLIFDTWQKIADHLIIGDTLIEQIGNYLFLWIFLGSIFWVNAFFDAAWPFAATLTLARRYGIRNVLYYLVCGAITGFILTPMLLLPDWYHPSEHEETFVRTWLQGSPSLMLVGASGAAAFWYVAGRHIGKRQRAEER